MYQFNVTKHGTKLASLLIAAMMLITLVGCGDTPENRLERARIAIQQGQFDQAVEHAGVVLQTQPENKEAHTIKSTAEIRLARYDDAEKSVDGLLKLDSNSLEGRQLQMDLIFGRLGKMIEQSTFVTDTQLQERFNKTIASGRQQVLWFDDQEGQKSEAALYRARLSMAEAQRLAREIEEASKKLENRASSRSGSAVNTRVDDLRAELKLKNREALDYLWESLELDSSDPRAGTMFVRLSGSIGSHADVWRLAELLGQRDNLSPGLVNTVMDELLRMPEGYQPIARRAQVGQAMLDRVPEAGRTSRDWRMSQAHVFVLQEKLNEAEPLLDAILKNNPRDLQGRYLMARLYFVRNQGEDMKKARGILDVLITEQRNSPMVLGLHGMTLAALGEYPLARESLGQARAMAPDNVTISAAWIRLMGDMNELTAAKDSVEAQYRNSPTDPNAISFKLRFEKLDGNKKEVAKVLADVDRITPRLDAHLPLLIDAAEYLEMYEKAAEYAQEFVLRQPDNLAAHLKLAESKLRLGQDEVVAAMLVELQEKFAGAPDIDMTLGRMYLMQRAFDRSADILEKVVQKQPDNLAARLLLARALVSMALTEQSLEQLNYVIDKDPRNVEARELASRVYTLTGDDDRALEQLQLIDSKMVDPTLSPLAAAALKLRAGELDEAARIANRALALGTSSNDPLLRLLLAQVYGRQEKFDQAEHQLVSMVRSWPDNTQAYKLLAKFYVERGQQASGVNVFRQLRAMNDPLARLSESALLLSMQQPREALDTLAPVFRELVEEGNRLALPVGDAMATIFQSARDYESAEKIYAALESIPAVRYTATYKRIGAAASRDGIDATVTRLEALVKILPPEQGTLRYAIARDFARYGKYDLAIAIVDQWIAERPDSVTLLLWKGELLTEVGRIDEAKTVLRDAIERKPIDATLYIKLARTQLVDFDYPGTEQTYKILRKVDVASRMLSLAAEGELYLSIGLDNQAVNAFAELETVARPSDPRVIYAIGRAYAAMDRDDDAIKRLEEVPAHAQEYVAAQLLITRLDQQGGRTDDARARLTKLMRDPRAAREAAIELLKLNVRDRRHEELLQWSDMVLQMDRMPATLRVQWHWMRAAIASDRGDWQAALTAINNISAIAPGDPRVDANRILLLWRLAKVTEAREVLADNEALRKSQVGPSLAVLLNVDSADTPARPPLISFFELLADGNVEGAAEVLDTLPPMKAIFKSDLQSVLGRPDIRSPEMVTNFQAMIAGAIASGLNADALAADISGGVISRAPLLMAAHAIQAQATMELGRPIDPVLRNARAAGDSSLSLLLQAQDAAAKKEFATAVSLLEELRGREPGNDHIQYMLVQHYQAVNEYDKAISILESLIESDSGYQAVAQNDLAYLLAEHRKDRIEEAYALAAQALAVAPMDPRLLDTAGWIEHLRGNDVAALDHLQRAIAGLPARPELHYHLGLTYRALGDETWARRHLEQASRSTMDVPEVRLAREALAG